MALSNIFHRWHHIKAEEDRDSETRSEHEEVTALKKSIAEAICPVHPGETLKQLLKAMKMSQRTFSIVIEMKESQLSELLNGKRDLNLHTAMLLEATLGTPAVDWINQQHAYDAYTFLHTPELENDYLAAKHRALHLTGAAIDRFEAKRAAEALRAQITNPDGSWKYDDFLNNPAPCPPK